MNTSFSKFITSAILLVICTSVKAQSRKDLSVVLIAPKEIKLSESRSFPVTINMTSSTGEVLPDTILLRADRGKWIDDEDGDPNDSTTKVKLSAGTGRAFLSMTCCGSAEKEPLGIYALLPQNGKLEIVGEQIQVRLRQQATLEVANKPDEMVLADGKTKFRFNGIIKDQWGKAMSGVPSLVYRTIGSEQTYIPIEESDEQGRVFYNLVPSTKEASVYLQFVTENQVSQQVVVAYLKNIPKPDATSKKPPIPIKKPIRKNKLPVKRH